ncbi:MAG: HlyD family efflux transporter periplasmic adaptor subunit, partial [Bacteroidota bacterium]
LAYKHLASVLCFMAQRFDSLWHTANKKRNIMGMDERIEKKRWSAKRIGWISVLAIAAVVFLTAIYRDTGKSRLNVEQARLLTDTIETGVFKEFITIFGTVEPKKTVYLDAIESGKIEEIFVEDGTMVERGQPIMRLTNLDLQLEVLNQEAQIVDQINTIRYQGIVQEQQSLSLREQALDVAYRIDLLSKRTERNRLLYQDSIIPQVEYEETQDEYEHLLRRRELLDMTIKKDSLSQVLQTKQMETSVDLMRRNLEFAKNSLDNLVIKAPINGQLSAFDSEIGELINQGSRVAQIDVLEDYKIRARVDEFYISRIFPNQQGSFTLDDKDYQLRIKKIYPDVQNGAFEVDLVFVGDRPENIKRGQTISLKLSLSDDTQAMLIGKGGFFQSTGGNWVYVLGADGIARRREIRLGRQNPNHFEILDGLSNGEIVIISSYDTYGEKEELVLQ